MDELIYLVGESIANENPEIKSDLTDACREARSAGKQTYFLDYAIDIFHSR
jgi:hypothetical protein